VACDAPAKIGELYSGVSTWKGRISVALVVWLDVGMDMMASQRS